MTKQTKWHMRPTRTLISLGIRLVWSESPLSAWRKVGSLATHWAHSEDSDQTGQTGQMPRLIWFFAGPTVVLLVLSWGGSFVVVLHWNLLENNGSSVTVLISSILTVYVVSTALDYWHMYLGYELFIIIIILLVFFFPTTGIDFDQTVGKFWHITEVTTRPMDSRTGGCYLCLCSCEEPTCVPCHWHCKCGCVQGRGGVMQRGLGDITTRPVDSRTRGCYLCLCSCEEPTCVPCHWHCKCGCVQGRGGAEEVGRYYYETNGPQNWVMLPMPMFLWRTYLCTLPLTL